jgi:hypothetical protein
LEYKTLNPRNYPAIVIFRYLRGKKVYGEFTAAEHVELPLAEDNIYELSDAVTISYTP